MHAFQVIVSNQFKGYRGESKKKRRNHLLELKYMKKKKNLQKCVFPFLVFVQTDWIMVIFNPAATWKRWKACWLVVGMLL